jgi:hypothetical protein
VLAAALALALALPACGGGGGESTAAAPKPEQATVVAPSPKTAPIEARAATTSGCADGLDGFLGQLEHLRRSLAIGVTYEQYIAELGTVRRSYEKVPVVKLDLACVSGPANSAESSFDGYLAAANTWGECVSDAACETEALEPKLRHKWQTATDQLAAAQRTLPTH